MALTQEVLIKFVPYDKRHAYTMKTAKIVNYLNWFVAVINLSCIYLAIKCFLISSVGLSFKLLLITSNS